MLKGLYDRFEFKFYILISFSLNMASNFWLNLRRSLLELLILHINLLN